MSQKIDVSTGVIIRAILVLLALWFLYMVLDVIALLLISFIVVSSMEPAIDWLQRRKIPRTLGVIIIYVIFLGLAALAVSFLIPPVISQFQQLMREFPEYISKSEDSFGVVKRFLESFNVQFDLQQILGNLGQGVTNVSGGIFSTTIGVFSSLISAVVVLSLAFYMSVEENGIKNFLVSITPQKHKNYVASITDRIRDSMGKWMLGQLILMLIIAVTVWLGLLLVGVPHALLLGVFAGIMEIIPYVGPIIGAVPGVALGFLASPTVGLLAIVVYVITQQLENHIIVPQVMKKAVGLSPIAVILVLLIGAKLGGVMGAILAVPVATAVNIFVEDLRRGKEM